VSEDHAANIERKRMPQPANAEFPRHYVAPDADFGQWETAEPYFEEIIAREITTLEAFERWLLEHRHFGPPIVRWRERGAVPRRAKWISSLMMASSGIGLQFFDQIPLWLRIATPAVMLAVAVWIWRRPDD